MSGVKNIPRVQKIPKSSRTKLHQAWVDEALAGNFKPGSAARLRKVAARARSGTAKPIASSKSPRRIKRLLSK